MAYWLGAPWDEDDRKAYVAAISGRPQREDKLLEWAVVYQYQILDRQINKAIGLLTFNALLFAAFSAVRASVDNSPFLITIGSLLALLSCLPLLVLFYVVWGPHTEFESAQQDLQAVCTTTYRRSYALTASIVLSTFATLLAIWVVFTIQNA